MYAMAVAFTLVEALRKAGEWRLTREGGLVKAVSSLSVTILLAIPGIAVKTGPG